jgi:hypothetical protein
VPNLRIALGSVRILRQPTFDEIRQSWPDRRRLSRSHQFEASTRYDDRQKAALAYAECITWDLPSDDALWERLHRYFSEPELVEIGYFVAITMGQQRWLRTLNIEHHQILAGTDSSMAPGFETMDALVRSKSNPNYWANKKTPPKTSAA